jgi:hypothetical protein
VLAVPQPTEALAVEGVVAVVGVVVAEAISTVFINIISLG